MKTYALLLCEKTERGYLPISTSEFSGPIKPIAELALPLMNATLSVRASQLTENGHLKVEEQNTVENS